MRTTLLPALVLAVLLGIAGNATAQPSPWQPERTTAGWVFTPGVSLGGLWDSNTTLVVKGGEQLKEWVGLVNPRGEIGFNGQHTHFDIGYSGSLEAYQTLNELTRYDQLGRLSLRHQASPRLAFTGTSSINLTPTTERLQIASVPFENVGSTLIDNTAGGTYALSQRTSISGSYNLEWISFDRQPTSLSTLQGGHSHTVLGTVTHAISSRASIGGSYSFEHANTGGGFQIVNVQDAIGTITYQFAAHTSVMGGAGLAQLNLPQIGEVQRGPSLHARLTHEFNRTQVEVTYDRSFVPSWNFGGTSTNEELRTSAFFPITNRLSVNLGVSYSRNDPIISSGDLLGLNSWWTSSSVGYAAARWLRIEGFFNGSFQDSTARGEVNRRRIGIQIVTSKPVRIQ